MGREGFEPSTLGLREGLGRLSRLWRVWLGAGFAGSGGDGPRLVSVGLVARLLPHRHSPELVARLVESK